MLGYILGAMVFGFLAIVSVKRVFDGTLWKPDVLSNGKVDCISPVMRVILTPFYITATICFVLMIFGVIN